MKPQQRINDIIERLKARYPGAVCSLTYRDPFQLLVAVRLSAQCTDARVNMITPALFKRFPTLDAFAEADPAEVATYIHSCGFFNAKSKDIVAAAIRLRDHYNGTLPDTIDELLTLPGVGRKTANLLCGDVYGQPAVVADTHCIRISGKLGLCDSKDPYKVELALKAILPPEESSDFCHRLVLFGRDVCTARSPRCSECPLADLCPSAGG